VRRRVQGSASACASADTLALAPPRQLCPGRVPRTSECPVRASASAAPAPAPAPAGPVGMPGAIRSPPLSADRVTVRSAAAPEAIGPYSQAVRSGELLFCSGQIPLDPQTGEIVGASAAEQARRCLE